MIHTHDRSYWMGASDTDKIVGNWKTETWRKWWLEKLGLVQSSNFQTKYTRAGTYYEKYILRELGLDITHDYQIKIPEYSLRVNYDGITFKDLHIYECKTFNKNKTFKVNKTYWRQAQTEMFALETNKLDIVAYPLDEESYKNYFTSIDKELIEYHPVERDEEFINNLLIPRLEILHECLEKGIFPERLVYEN